MGRFLGRRKFQLPLGFSTLALMATATISIALFSIESHGRLASAENAPLQIKRHDQTITIAADASWKLAGVIDIKVNTAQGRSIMSAYKFPLGDDLEDLKIISAEAFEPTANRTIAKEQIVLRDLETTLSSGSPLLKNPRAYTIAFGEMVVGTVARIKYEIELKKPRIPGVFSMTFEWGREYPELAGTLTLESKEPLYFDISKAARETLEFTKGRQPGGAYIWKAELKKPIFMKPEGEQGGILSTALVSRVQISNKNSWTPVIDALLPKFTPPEGEPLPPALRKIVEAAKVVPSTDERINRVLDLLHQTISYSRDWSHDADGFTPQKLSNLTQVKRGDCKDFALATVMILRALGYTADVALVWRQSPTEKIWIDETPSTPSLSLFNHAIVRLNESGRMRYFDPTNPVAFAEGFLSDIGGSWALTLTRGAPSFERLPAEAAMPSQIKITQSLDMRPDASIVGSGVVKVEGPLAAELKQVYFAQGAAQVEPYLRSLFGLALKTESVSPMIRVNTQDRRGKTFELSFSYLAPSVIQVRGAHREFDLATPGLAGVPMLSSRDRATDVILSRNLIMEIETKVLGGEIADETNTSCLALTSFASVLRETRALPGAFIINDHIQFKTERIASSKMKTPGFQNEIQAYASCLTRTHAVVGPRPAFERSQLPLDPAEIAVLKKPVMMVNLQDIKVLDEINSPQLSMLINTKTWLAAREMLRKNQRSGRVILEYANALLQTGHVHGDQADTFLADHVSEAAKLFGAAGVQEGKTAKFHRVHATMLLATDRPKEAIVALLNAMALEKGQAKDALLGGRIYLRMGDDAKAEEWLRQATLQRGSKSLKIAAIENLATFRLKQRKVPEFIRLYRQAISEIPTNAWIYHHFAKHLQSVKMWDLSIEQSRKSLGLLRFPEAEALLAATLMRKAESIYYSAPGIVTADPRILESAEQLALECLKYNRSDVLAYRIAGHATFLKAMNGDYGSLIATQSYFAKAIELGADDAWIQDRYNMANQALETSRPIAQIWTAFMAAKNRVPAAKNIQTPAPAAPAPGTTRFPVQSK